MTSERASSAGSCSDKIRSHGFLLVLQTVKSAAVRWERNRYAELVAKAARVRRVQVRTGIRASGVDDADRIGVEGERRRGTLLVNKAELEGILAGIRRALFTENRSRLRAVRSITNLEVVAIGTVQNDFRIAVRIRRPQQNTPRRVNLLSGERLPALIPNVNMGRMIPRVFIRTGLAPERHRVLPGRRA